MSADPKGMLDQLVDAIAIAAGLVRAPGDQTHKPQIWSHDVDESVYPESDDPPATYTVLRIYPGPPIHVSGADEVSVQSLTRGVPAAAAWAQCQAVLATLRNADGRPRIKWALSTFLVKGIRSLREPGQIGRDERGRVELVFNFNVAFVPIDGPVP